MRFLYYEKKGIADSLFYLHDLHLPAVQQLAVMQQQRFRRQDK